MILAAAIIKFANGVQISPFFLLKQVKNSPSALSSKGGKSTGFHYCWHCSSKFVSGGSDGRGAGQFVGSSAVFPPSQLTYPLFQSSVEALLWMTLLFQVSWVGRFFPKRLLSGGTSSVQLFPPFPFTQHKDPLDAKSSLDSFMAQSD